MFNTILYFPGKKLQQIQFNFIALLKEHNHQQLIAWPYCNKACHPQNGTRVIIKETLASLSMDISPTLKLLVLDSQRLESFCLENALFEK